MKRVSVLFVLILVASLSLFGLVIANNVESAYDDGNDGSRSSNNQMKTLIILSAGHFLNSYSGYQAFLNRIEMAELTGVNYEELRSILNNTISGIESARAAYDALKNLAENTEYNQGFIASLVSFNYPGFCETNGLNTVIFSMVAKLLVRGNVTGVFDYILDKTVEIAGQLYNVKQTLDKNMFPDIALLWEINQTYCFVSLFGQYAAMTFKAIQ